MTRHITRFDSDTDEEMVQRLDRFANKIADPATSEVFHAAGSRILVLSEQVDRMRSALLAALWHHQGGSSAIGQPIRRLLGIGQHEHLTDEQVKEAKAFVHGDLQGHNPRPIPPASRVVREYVAGPFVLTHPSRFTPTDAESKVPDLGANAIINNRVTMPLADVDWSQVKAGSRVVILPAEASGLELPAPAESQAVPDEVLQQQLLLSNPATQVFFRAGLLACREHLATIFEGRSTQIAAAIREAWWPDLGKDYGAPREQLQWEEMTEGELGQPGFRVIEPVPPTLEALPIAWDFLHRRTGLETETSQ